MLTEDIIINNIDEVLEGHLEPKEKEDSIYKKTLCLDDFTEESRQFVVDYICPLCKGIYYNPVIDPCGHIFCQRCFNAFTSSIKPQIVELRCPITNQPLSQSPSTIGLIANILDKQTLNCSNKKIGCGWKGIVKDFVEHIEKDCPKQTLKCSSKGCECMILRENMEDHLKKCEFRIVNCTYCNQSLAFNQLNEHFNSCPKYPIKCPQKCELMIEREKLNEHLSKLCPNTSVKCDFSVIGCDEEFLNKNKESHMSSSYNSHLKKMLQYVIKENKELHLKINELQKQIRSDVLYPSKSVKSSSQKSNTVNTAPVTKTQSHIDNHQNFMPNILQFTGVKRQREDGPNENDKDNDESLKNNQPIRTGCNEVEVINPPSLTSITNKNGKIYYDVAWLPQGVTIIDNLIKFTANAKTEHKFVFSTLEMKQDVPTQWKIEIAETSSWIAFGVCDKKKVISNKMKFFSSNRQFNHGTFLISSNNYLWNCNVEKENNFFLLMPKFEKGKEIIFTYYPIEKELKFEIGAFFSKLSDVRPIVGSNLTACIVFLHSGNSVRLVPLDDNKK